MNTMQLFWILLSTNMFLLVFADISLDTCSMSCGSSEPAIKDALVSRVVGSPGKRGPTGPPGPAGPPGEAQLSCDCPRMKALEEKVAELEQRLMKLALDKNNLIKDGWMKIGSHFYKLFKSKVPYETAKQRCEAVGAKLASTGYRDSSIRNDIVTRLIKPGNYNTWIGLDDLKQQGKYVWLDGVSSYAQNTPWGRDEPSNPKERCAHSYTVKNWMLNDAMCHSSFYFLCEI